MKPKIAVVVFVKNEYPDFCAWLSWYFAIGVDTVIVYDDHSTDGTWEASLAASRCLDVRTHRTDLSVQPFTARQREVYLGAIRTYRDEFDWIGFLDADEYLYLRDGQDVPSFLGQFPDAAAIAFSWCIYGSNRHLLKPNLTTVEDFTRHSLPEFGHNRSVKSFVRPQFVVDRWQDPHTFDVGGRPYIDAQGELIRWGGPGAISDDPDWSNAKLMHFIPRSMEHFIERIRRRSDLQGLTNEYWGVFDKNDIEDLRPLALVPHMKRFLFMITHEIMVDFCDALTAGDQAGERAIGHEHGSERRSALIRIVTTGFDTVLAADAMNKLVHVPRAQLGLEYRLVYAISPSAAPDVVHLYAPGGEGPLQVAYDPRITDILTYRAVPVPETDRVNLERPGANRFLTTLPLTGAAPGETAADRWAPSEWEQFTLSEIASPFDLLHQVGDLIATTGKAETVGDIGPLAGHAVSPMVVAAVMQLLPADQRTALARRASLLPAWV